MRLAAIHSLTVAHEARKSALPGFLGRLLAFARARRMRHAVLAELHGLDARTLADLCLYPGDFPAIADGTYIREGGAHDFVAKPSAEAPAQSVGRRPYY